MDIRADSRVELFSILFHLAGAPEYARPFDTPYRRAVEAHFAAFREHPAVTASRALHDRYLISFNAPLSLAVFLDPERLVPLVPLATAGDELDPRWRGVQLDDYLAKVAAFAAATGFAGFFASQRPYISAVEKRLAGAVADQKIEGWFADLLGPLPGATVLLVPGLLTGPSSYEATSHDAGGTHVYEVVELEGVDQDGLPVPTWTTVELLVQLLGYAYVNPLVEHHAAALQTAVPLFARVKGEMERRCFGSWKIMVAESLVRAITLLFIADRRGAAAAQAAAQFQARHAFPWVAALAARIRQMAAPPPVDLAARVPELAAFFDELARSQP